MQLSTDELIIILEIVAFCFGIIVLYHLVFVAMGLRRIIKRFDTVTEQVEEVVMKPITMADTIVEWLTDTLHEYQKKQEKKAVAKHKSKSKKKK